MHLLLMIRNRLAVQTLPLFTLRYLLVLQYKLARAAREKFYWGANGARSVKMY